MANLSLRMLYFCLFAAVLINGSNYAFMRIFYPGGKRVSNYYYPKTESAMETDRSLLYSEVMFRFRGFSSNSNNKMISTFNHHEIFHNNKSLNATELNDVIVEVSYCPVLPPGLGEINIHSNLLDEKQLNVIYSNLKVGGVYQPSTCKARQSAAVIIAYRGSYVPKFGGAVAMTPEQYSKVNGFSNKYWGNDADFEDLYYRVINANYFIEITLPALGKYKTWEKHTGAVRVKSEYIATVSPLYLLDGLTSLSYKVELFEAKRLYTDLKVEIYETNDTENYKQYYDKLHTTSTQTIQIKATTATTST